MRRSETFQMQAASIGILALAACLLAPSLAPVAQPVEGTVTRVVDGDIVWAENVHGTKLRIRLMGIGSQGWVGE